MAEMRYLDFDLLIERAEEGYTARVLNSPAGQAAADFRLPFSELELENFLLRVGRTRRGVRRLESPEMQAAKVFGGRLFRALFGNDVQGCLRSSLDEADRQRAGLRVRLRLAEAPELADLPWEYLYNPALNRFLVLSAETPLVRYLDLPERIQPLAVRPPLRVLVMISSPSDHPPLDVEQEWEKLKEALGDLEQRGLVALERLREATLTALQRRLRRGAYHIFHFIGHGTFDERAQDGVLLLEDEYGRGRPVSGQYLGTLLHDERTLRLAILNACEGARTARTDPFAGAAQSLVQQGIPAVIAMQFEITDEAAITLAHEFYAAVADGYPVDAALAEARKAIFARENDVEWGTPVLYMRSPDGRIFDIERVSERERGQAQIAALYREAQAAMAGEDWATAIEKLQAVLAMDPAHAGAAARLSQARRQQELVTLYDRGRAHYEASRWREALGCFRQVQEVRGDYKDVGTLIATLERAVARDKAVPAPRPAPPGLSRWLWMGIPGAVMLLLLVCGGGYLALRPIISPTDTPTPTQIMTPTDTPTPTHTPTPRPTDTPTPRPTDTPKPAPTDTPKPAPTDTPAPVEISQTLGQASAWFGDSPAYVSVGQGQSFVVRRKGVVKEIQIYLESTVGNPATDQIICDLRNADMVVLESTSIEGFSSGGGWKSFAFNTSVDPGTYIFTCYLHNSYTLEEHHYGIHGNANDNSYLEGTRYVSVGGHPEDGSTWEPNPWDLKFKIKMEVLD